ncbi:MAG: hydrolase 2, exosortase A system-associated [Burkholderiales bacterium]|nr:hydrolase 2, exosortase A system-associated [Burkholderiales bacterium]
MPDIAFAPPSLEVFYRDGQKGRLFCALHAPVNRPPLAACLYLHPFAEEMNKARRMAALQARALAAAGWLVLQQDHFGCGDSEADFSAAAWDLWVADGVSGAEWLADHAGLPVWLWGLRAGCLLASAAAPSMADCPGMIFWQPVVSGRQHLQQFLRLKLAGDRLTGRDNGGDARRGPREALLDGETVEVAGYSLSPQVAAGLDAARLSPPPGTGVVGWFEVSGAAEPTLSPVSRTATAEWQAAGWQVDARPITGSGFWQTQEIETAPGLLAATLAFAAESA